MYDRIGFQDTYLILGCFVLAMTVLSAFTLSGTPLINPLKNRVAQ
jgi:MFS transporter, OHS family, lactose permease